MVDVKQAVLGVFDEAVALRRDFHMYPEIGNKEVRTPKIIAEKLRSWGIEVQENVGGTGLIGLIKGAKPGKCIAFRADMDCLPVEEETGLSFSSKVPGMMHACGHDGHVATLLMAAKILSGMKDQLAGSVKLLFQHAEEQAPAGGSLPMVNAGALENPHVDTVLALHIFPDIPTGNISICSGPASSTADVIYIDVIGKGGHGSEPHTAHDAVVAAAEIVCALQTVVSRWLDPKEFAVVTIGQIHAGTAPNIIPGTARMELSVRSLNEKTRLAMKDAIITVTENTAKAMGAKAEIDYIFGYETVYNTPDAVELAFAACNKYLGEGVLIPAKAPINGSEDFSYFPKTCGSGAMMILGGNIKGAPLYMNHNSKFDWDEEAMKTGIGAFVAMALEYLQ